MKALVWIAAPLLLVGCIGEEEKTVVEQGSKVCDEAAFEFLIGQPKEAVEKAITPDELRVVLDGSPMTMDHRPDRLNVFHDEDGKIIGVRCG